MNQAPPIDKKIPASIKIKNLIQRYSKKSTAPSLPLGSSRFFETREALEKKLTFREKKSHTQRHMLSSIK